MEKELAFIRVENICKSYRDGESVNKVLSHINFTINKGELVAVIGDSGSGKTTLMNLLGALDKPDSGKIIIDNKEITCMNTEQQTLYRRNNLGFIFQDYNLIHVLNVYENIILPLQLSNKVIDEKKIDLLLQKLLLKDKKYTLPERLSGGEQQRVAIIRAILHEPKLILADEPTGNLDGRNTAQVIKILQVLCKNMNRTTILVTHNMQIANLCDRVIEIKNGSVIQEDEDEKN